MLYGVATSSSLLGLKVTAFKCFSEADQGTVCYFTFSKIAQERDGVSAIIDGQNLLELPPGLSGSDLPDYATAMTDPRFAKKPIYPVPPPPYAAVVSMPPDTQSPDSRVTNTDGNAQENPKP